MANKELKKELKKKVKYHEARVKSYKKKIQDLETKNKRIGFKWYD